MMQKRRLSVMAAIILVSAAQTGISGGLPAELNVALDAQSEEAKARYAYRHPGATLDFFGIKPGMTVVEALPGAGWYSRILVPYLGAEGQLIGADYAQSIWPRFGFFSEEQIAEREVFVENWPVEAVEWGDAGVAAFKLGSLPDDMKGTADAVLLIRALHNLARFESEGGYLTDALADVHAVLKPGGVVGVVQHQARAEMPDEWANGSRGYLKKAFVVERMEAAGFEFLGANDLNTNDKDRPTVEDIVWRLPPTFATSRDNPEMQEELKAIGESNRMTLKFRKPE